MRLKTVLLFGLLFFLPQTGFSATYEVGPGKSYANIGDVPWESMGAGDTVLIFWRQAPYREKWVIAVQGTEQTPFTVRGVANAGGELPVIDGENATTRSSINFWNEARGVVKIGGANSPNVDEPSWIVVENLNIKNGRTPHQFTGRYGLSAYADNAASIYVERGRNITLRNCVLHDSGNGLFVSHATRDILIEQCWIYDNGIENSIYQHNTYTAAIGIIFQFNRFGPLRTDCGGNNLKDRSAGLTVRYNWIEGGNRQMDVVDAEDSPEIVNHADYRKTFVYGNILIEPADAGNSQILHYGGDSGDVTIYRKGTLHFYNNTVVSTRTDNTTLLRLSTNDESCDCRNNIIWTTATGNRLALLNQAGVVHLANNFLKTGWQDSHSSGFTGIIYDDGGNFSATDPRFVDANLQDYRLNRLSLCVDSGTILHSEAYPIAYQYQKHQASEARVSAGNLDLGAFEIGRPLGASYIWLLLQ